MPDNSTSQYLLRRDGTSQADRQLAALDPAYVAVDERSLKDLLAFAQQYAKELRYFNLDNQALGDWSAFLSPDLDLDEVVAFLKAPEDFPPHRAAPFQRPHFVLFLSFLQLLRHVQDQLNTLTQRHLDFYYQQVLHMSRQAAVPDQVNILLAPATNAEQVHIPAGTQLNAGTDSLGQDLVYQTDRDIVVNQAQVEQLCSVYVKKRVTGIHEARGLLTGDPALMAMLSIALGDPEPGDGLPKYKTGEDASAEVDADFLRALQQLVNFVHTGLYLEFFEFRELMRLKQQRDNADAEWAEINAILEQAGKNRTEDPAYQLNPTASRDFDTNLKKALGNPSDFDRMFDGIPEVENIYDAYDKRIRKDVQERITERLYLPAEDAQDSQDSEDLKAAPNPKNFTRLMQLKVRIDNEWQEINRILEKAGQTKRTSASFTLTVTDPTAFEDNLKAALDLDQAPLNFSLASAGLTNIDTYYAAFLQVERFFFLSAENFSDMLSLIQKPTLSTQDWATIEQLLTRAHQEKVYTARRAQLQVVREADGFDAMLNAALDQAGNGDQPLSQLKGYLKKESDIVYLTDISKRKQGTAVTDAEWAEVYRIVEIAQRNREGLRPPIAQKVEWLNLYPATDATTQSVSLGVAGETDEPRWKTFGQGHTSLDTQEPAPAPIFGWALCYCCQGLVTC